MAKKSRQKVILEKGAEKATRWIGSMPSLMTHTAIFILSFALPLFGVVTIDHMLLVLTTILSLEAIYLAIFIQMSVNKNTADIEVIAEDVGDIAEDVEDIQEDVDEIQKDVDEIQEDVDEIQEDIEEIEEDSDEDLKVEKKEAQLWSSIQTTLAELQKEIEELKKK